MAVVTVVNFIVILMAYLARFEKNRLLLAWAFILLAVVLGIRYKYGNDYLSYRYIFVHGESDQNAEIEVGWLFLMTVFRPIGFYGFVLGLSLIEHFMLWDIIRRHVNPNWYWLAVFIYTFNSDYMLIGLSMIRQFFVMLLGFYAVELAMKKKIIPFLLIIIFGFLVHKATLLYSPLYFLPYITKLFSSKWMLIFVFAMMAVVFVSMMKIIEVIIPMINDTGEIYAMKYLSDKVLNDEHSLGRRYIIHYAVYMLFLFRNFNKLDKYGKCVALEVVLGCFIIPFYNLFFLAIRLSWMFTIVEIVSFPLLISLEKRAILKYGTTFLFMIFVVLFEFRYIFYSETYGRHYQVFRTIFEAPDFFI